MHGLRHIHGLLVLGLGVGLVLTDGRAWAVDNSSCTPVSTYAAWQSANLVSGAASAPATDTPYIPAGRPLLCSTNTVPCGRTYFAKGTTLYAFEDRGTSGTLAWSWVLPTAGPGENSGTTIDNFPSPVPSDGFSPLVIYLGGANGRLYKLDAQSGCTPPCINNSFPMLTADLRRKDVNGDLLCNIPPGDGIGATPAVLLNAYSGSLFQNFAAAMGHAGADLVFAMTRNGCGDRTHNAVYALWSDNFALQWVFQGSDAGNKVDAFTEGCYVRYELGPRVTVGSDYTQPDPHDPVLFCGTLLDGAATGQDSVFALNAITTNANKRVIWSHNAGSISNRPMLNTNAIFGQRLYVANQAGSMTAYGPDGDGLGGPNIYWSANVTPGSTINRSPWIEPRGGTFKDKILVLDTAGVLRAYQDDGASASAALWVSSSTGTATWVSLPIVLPGMTASYAYVGRNDGFLQQVNLASGSAEGRQQVNSLNAGAGNLVFDPSLDIQSSSVVTVNRAYVVVDGLSGPALKRFKLPFCSNPGSAASAPACVTNPDGTKDCNLSRPIQATGAE